MAARIITVSRAAVSWELSRMTSAVGCCHNGSCNSHSGETVNVALEPISATSPGSGLQMLPFPPSSRLLSWSPPVETNRLSSTAAALPKLVPPFSLETAKAKVQFAEDAWNSKAPERVSLAYTPDSQWRNRTEFFQGREAIKNFLRRKWAKELGYRLMKELWCFTDNRIAVRFEYEWHDEQGQWYRTHGNEMWEFDGDGLMRRRDMSANDYKIQESERRVKCDAVEEGR